MPAAPRLQAAFSDLRVRENIQLIVTFDFDVFTWKLENHLIAQSISLLKHKREAIFRSTSPLLKKPVLLVPKEELLLLCFFLSSFLFSCFLLSHLGLLRLVEEYDFMLRDVSDFPKKKFTSVHFFLAQKTRERFLNIF